MKAVARFFHFTSLTFQALLLFAAIPFALVSVFSKEAVMGYAFFAFLLGSLQMIDALIRSFVFYNISKYYLSHFVFGLLYTTGLMYGMFYVVEEKIFAEFIQIGYVAIFFVIIPLIAAIVYFINSQNGFENLKKTISEFV